MYQHIKFEEPCIWCSRDIALQGKNEFTAAQRFLPQWNLIEELAVKSA